MADLLEQLHNAKTEPSQEQDSLVQKEDIQKKSNVTGLTNKEIQKLNSQEAKKEEPKTNVTNSTKVESPK